MSNFQAARKNMVDCQIHPSGVINPQILEIFEKTQRELFSGGCRTPYKDEDIIFKDGRFILDPTVQARMVQALEPGREDVVLDVGCATGYSSAILSPLVSAVIALESKEKYFKEAEESWQKIGLYNIISMKGPLKSGCKKHAPYDRILLNGAITNVPETLVEQLKPNSRMIFIMRPKESIALGHVTLLQTLENGQYSTRPLFEVASPYLPGFEPDKVFQF